MKIVVLDGYCLNPGDLSWDPVAELGDLTVHDRTPDNLILERVDEAEIVLTNKTPLSAKTLSHLPCLKYIGLLATGYNVVDVDAAALKKIVVTHVPSYGTASVAQMVFAHLLNMTQHVADHARSVREGKWSASRDFCYWEHDLTELSGLVLGLIGFGRIGMATAKIGIAMGMEVIACDKRMPEPVPDGVKRVDLDTVFRKSDVLSLHCPLTTDTQNLIDHDRLATMKKSALLINTSRGPLVDEPALAAALNQGVIAGACLDVLCTEPPRPDHPLLTARNCVITPHIAWANKAARIRLMEVVVQNLKAYLAGKPQNRVDP
ncbi:MAG: D-2-hydroxyacid dehydrogenase [Planctomycetota bacterium]